MICGVELSSRQTSPVLQPHRGAPISSVQKSGICSNRSERETGDGVTWQEPGVYVGEPVFVSSPAPGHEDEGVVPSVVLDAPQQRSYLLALDAQAMTKLARARAPHVIPHGIHGAFSGGSYDGGVV